MIPLLAAASAVSTVSDIASSAATLWQSLSSSSSHSSTGTSGSSFAELLAAHGVPSGTAHHGAMNRVAAASAAAAGLVNTIA